MDLLPSYLGEPSRLRLLLDHFALIEDPREPHRVAFPLAELLLLAVCGTIADCDDYDAIALWGGAGLRLRRRSLMEKPAEGRRTSPSCAGSCRSIMVCPRGGG